MINYFALMENELISWLFNYQREFDLWKNVYTSWIVVLNKLFWRISIKKWITILWSFLRRTFFKYYFGYRLRKKYLRNIDCRRICEKVPDRQQVFGVLIRQVSLDPHPWLHIASATCLTNFWIFFCKLYVNFISVIYNC